MESVYAALLLNKASQEISEAAIEKILKAAGATVDKSQIKTLVAGLEGKNIDEYHEIIAKFVRLSNIALEELKEIKFNLI